MRIQVNGSVGAAVHHSRFGTGLITEVTDKYIAIDFPEKKAFKAAKWPHRDIVIGQHTLVELVFDRPKGSYEIELEFICAVKNPEATSPTRTRTLTFNNVTEAEAAEICRKRVTAYTDYEGGFFINKVTKVEAVG